MADSLPWRILTGHVLDVLRSMPESSVHCVVTSPPYWSLRDYNTATWEGGDPACDHRPTTDVGKSIATSTLTGGKIGTGAVGNQQMRFTEVCHRCGAVRVEPTVWDGDPLCEHEWGAEVTKTVQPQRDHAHGGVTNPTGTRGAQKWTEGSAGTISLGNTCMKCGAWRGALGLEPTPEMYVAHVVEVFREIRRVLRPDGTAWLDLGDTYAANRSYQVHSTMGGHKHGSAQGFEGRGMRVPNGLKPKDLVGIPWRVAFALQADGWWLRAAIVWTKPNCLPESTRDRPTRSYENVFLLAKNERYFYDREAVLEPLKESSYQRISQASFDLQQGREKDYGKTGVNPNRSARRTLENLRDRVYKHDSHSRFGKRSPNRVWGDPESLDRLLSGRNMRDVWSIPTKPFPGAHFATMPEALVLPCVKAGTSERGCCPECGTPWTRVLARTKHPTRDPEAQRAAAVEQTGRGDGKTPGPGGKVDVVEHAGWKPGCSHGHEPVPAIILDPFVGSGTVGVVAIKHGRHFVGIDVNPEYAKMAESRIGKVDPLFQQSGTVMSAPPGVEE